MPCKFAILPEEYFWQIHPNSYMYLFVEENIDTERYKVFFEPTFGNDGVRIEWNITKILLTF